MIEENIIKLHHRIVVLTGMDRCGKSTQAQLLSDYLEDLNFQPVVIHYGKPLYDSIEYQYSYYTQEFYSYLSMLENDSRSVLILDRCFTEECVWSEYRPYSGNYVVASLLSTNVFEEIDNQFIFFHFKDEWEFYKNRNDGDSLFDNNREEFEKTSEKFDEMFEYINEFGFSPETIEINLDNYPRDKKKSIKQIHGVIKNSI